jgi:peptide/nickel transport system permease protein
MGVRQYVTQRVLLVIPTVIGLTVITFVISHMIPADPAMLVLGENATPAQIEALRHSWGLDQPLYVQYIRFLIGFLQGDFGVSTTTHHSVMSDVLLYFPATLELVLAAMSFGIIVGVLLGTISAVKKDSITDYTVRGVSLVGICMPVYWSALVVLGVVYLRFGLVSPGRLSTGVAPPLHITGLYVVDSLVTGNFPVFLDALKHLALPMLVLGGWILGPIARQTRAGMLECLEQEYVLAARAKGLSETTVIWKHTLRNALNATLTIVGITVGSLLGGAVVTETIFSWPGLGSYMLSSTLTIDFGAIVGGTAVIGLMYTFVNLIVDLLYGFVDPKVRYA